MNTPKRSVGRRLVAALGVAALSLAGAVGITTSAHAADAVISNIDTDHPVSLTIHKYPTPTWTGIANDGTVRTPPTGATGIDGVRFSIQKVKNIDLSTFKGWEDAKAIVNGTAGAPTPELGEAENVTTANGGTATYNTQTQGLYYVTETSVGTNAITNKAVPFYVTLPLPSTGNGSINGWLYDVHVYPKNSVTEVSKSVTDPSTPVVGQTITWPITVKIPDLEEGQHLTSLVVTDTLDDRLQYGSTALAVDSVPVTTLESSLHYNATIDAQALTVTLTETGLTELEDHQGKTLTVTVTTTVASIGTGTITNSAVVNLNGTNVETGIPSSVWGGLAIVKNSTTGAALSGAVFSVYKSQEDAERNANPLAVGQDNATTVKTNANGQIVLAGLYIGKSGPNGSSAAPTSAQYWIREITPPAGFLAPTNPVSSVTIKAGSANAQTLYNTVVVTNTQQPPVNLPLTGANGQLLALIGGGSLVLLAAGTALVARKRSHQD